MTTLPQTFRPSMPIEIVDDEDVALLLRRENVDPLVCISVEEIGHESPEMKPKPPQSSHNLHVNTMHELQSDNDVLLRETMALMIDQQLLGKSRRDRKLNDEVWTARQQLDGNDDSNSMTAT
ncbi:hypothetical protein LWI29_007202 [Acer saccharum]|uniref:Uncharacterized protein n=1 Tax=Acer saccharum TaxID=4024 RepID=A0AA39T2W4_ACESA|nr:hypothetical protein LWI29_007202 [Acer saccharum]